MFTCNLCERDFPHPGVPLGDEGWLFCAVCSTDPRAAQRAAEMDAENTQHRAHNRHLQREEIRARETDLDPDHFEAIDHEQAAAELEVEDHGPDTV
jgi:hypothetical protein